ncbi:unnamed protein product [Sphenostylis stenocarpa]|uniref:Transmembrane protein n=1 Tax=Sphenostylis stenocarpa TaxID=92480 RepID=A0AA86V7Q3_9FABA|nr:unnamed protein product [Sphenostylis stenocarpa]
MGQKKHLRDFISEAKHIIKAHIRHFLVLSLTFLFPLSLSLLLSPTLSDLFNNLFSNNSHTFLPPHTTNPTSLLYYLFLMLFSNGGVISITYSVYHFFHDQPVNLVSSFKSIYSFSLPLLATTIVSQLILFVIYLFYGLLLLLLISRAQFLHLTLLPHLSPYIIGFFIALPLILVQMYLHVNWTLVYAIVVVESCWGLEPLRRSARLIKGMKGVALSSIFYYGNFAVIFVLGCFFATRGYNSFSESWIATVFNWVMIVTYAYFIAMLMLSQIVVTTVLYIYCKANNDVEIAEEFGKYYISLPFDDGKVSQVV